MVHAALMQAVTIALVAWNNKVLKGAPQSYMEYPGGAKAIDAAFDNSGKLWIVGKDAEIYYESKDSWTRVAGGGAAKALSGACEGPYAVMSGSYVYKWMGFNWLLIPPQPYKKWNGSNWTTIDVPITTKDVGSDGRTPWMIEREEYKVYYLDNGTWTGYPADIKAVKIAVARDGTPYVIDQAGKIFKGTGKAWTELPGGKTATDVAIGSNGTVWIINAEGSEAWYMIQGKWYKHPGGKEGIAIAAP